MPWSLWKSRFEIRQEEWARLEAELREQAEERAADRAEQIAELRASLEQLDARGAEVDENHARELAGTRKFRQEMLARMVAHDVSMNKLEKQLVLMRKEAEDASRASTAALFRLVDRFDEFEERRPPGSGRMGPRSA